MKISQTQICLIVILHFVMTVSSAFDLFDKLFGLPVGKDSTTGKVYYTYGILSRPKRQITEYSARFIGHAVHHAAPAIHHSFHAAPKIHHSFHAAPKIHHSYHAAPKIHHSYHAAPKIHHSYHHKSYYPKKHYGRFYSNNHKSVNHGIWNPLDPLSIANMPKATGGHGYEYRHDKSKRYRTSKTKCKPGIYIWDPLRLHCKKNIQTVG